MTTYEKIIDRHGSEINYHIEILEDKLKSVRSSLESWRDLNKHKDSDHDGQYNRKHYIDHFYGMEMGLQDILRNLLYVKDAQECYCFDCKHYSTQTIDCIGAVKGYCKLYDLIVNNDTNKKIDCDYKDLNK